MQPVNGLSLESYLQIHKALTKNGNVVQSVTPIEECYYKISDLRQLLQLHGFTAGKFNRTELLAAMKGQELINPCSLTTITTDEQACDQQQASTTSSPSLPFTASDVCAVLGMPEPNSEDVQPLQVLQLSSMSGYVEAPAPANGPVADNQPVQASDLTAVAAAAATGPTATAAGALAVAVATQQPQHPCSDPVNPPSATTPTQQLHNQHQQQVQLPVHVPNTQDHPQLAAVCSQQRHHTSQPQQHQQQQQQQTASTQQQQQQQQQQQPTVPHQQQLPAAATTTATGTLHSLPQGEALHQLLAALLACQPPAAGSSSMPLQAAAQPQQPTLDLLQQLITCAGATGGPRPSTSYTAAHQPAAANQSTAQAAATAVQNTAPATGQPAASAAVAAGAGTTGLHTHLSTHPCKHSGQGTAAAAVAPAVDLDELSGPSHTPWLKLQLQWFQASGILAAPAAAAAAEGSTGSLLGRRVGFVLLEEMQVAGLRNSILTLPAGVYEGMAVKYLGSNCQFEVCEAGCPGQHEFYRARILPPRVVPEGPAGSSCSAELAASLAQAHAAASGRPVLLILDLHPRLRSHSLEGLMQIDAPEQLQDAWVLLEHEEEPGSPAASQPVETAAAAVPTAPHAQKRGRKPGSSSNSRHGQCKRAKA